MLLCAALLRHAVGLCECCGCYRAVPRVLAAHRHASGVGADEVAVETPIWAAMWALVRVPKWVLLCAALLRHAAGLRGSCGCYRAVPRVLAAHKHASGVGADEIAGQL